MRPFLPQKYAHSSHRLHCKVGQHALLSQPAYRLPRTRPLLLLRCLQGKQGGARPLKAFLERMVGEALEFFSCKLSIPWTAHPACNLCTYARSQGNAAGRASKSRAGILGRWVVILEMLRLGMHSYPLHDQIDKRKVAQRLHRGHHFAVGAAMTCVRQALVPLQQVAAKAGMPQTEASACAIVTEFGATWAHGGRCAAAQARP